MGWSSLTPEIKLQVLRFLTLDELLQVVGIDRETTRLATLAWREKMGLQTAGDSQGHFLSLDAVRWALSSNQTFRLLAQLPAFIPSEVTLGRKIGSGGTNSVFLVNEHEGILIKDAGARGGFSREYDAMVKMGSMGLRTVLRDLRFAQGKIQIVMDRINGCVDSKTIIGYQRDLKHYIDPSRATPCPRSKDALSIRGETLNQLLCAWDLMVAKQRFFADFQFLLDPQGEVYLNDPTAVMDKARDDGTHTIIQAIIDTFEYIHRLAGDKDWQAFKQFKNALRITRLRTFGQAWGCNSPYSPPYFTVINYRYCWYQNPSPSTMFISPVQRVVAGFTMVVLAGGLYGYFDNGCAYSVPQRHEWGKWNDLLSLL